MARATPEEIRLLEVVKDLDGTSDTKIPTQDYLDEWANLNSFGLLQKHPTITPGTVSILSNILALNLTWDDFFAPDDYVYEYSEGDSAHNKR